MSTRRRPRRHWNTRWQRFKCALGLHWWFRKQRLTESSDLVGCACCGREWGMNHDVRSILPWDYMLEQMYRDRGIVIRHDVKPPGIAPRGYAENLP